MKSISRHQVEADEQPFVHMRDDKLDQTPGTNQDTPESIELAAMHARSNSGDGGIMVIREVHIHGEDRV